MSSYIWEGKKVRLRNIAINDWEDFHRNDLDSEAAKSSDAVYFPRSPEGTKIWTENETKKGSNGDNIRLAIETLDGKLVGSISTDACDSRNGTFKYGVAIFREHWNKGFASDSIKIILKYYFEELRYQKVNIHIYSFNEASIKLHENLGFNIEGRIRRMIFTSGQFFDGLIYGMTKEEFDKLSSTV